MKVGTRSVLFGIHCPIFHGPTVWWAYFRLYGFWEAFSLPVIAACFLHDIGYWGKSDMDGESGLHHPELGADLMHSLFDQPDDEWFFGPIYRSEESYQWYNFTLYHSRSYAKLDGVPYSKLCVADKLAMAITPRWFYLLVSSLTGEINEYMEHFTISGCKVHTSKGAWLDYMQVKLYVWAWQNKDVTKQKVAA